MYAKLFIGLSLVACSLAGAQVADSNQDGIQLSQFTVLPAPKTSGLVLKRGDRLAICGDSITEQKRYSRLLEDYLTVCVPELNVTVRQFGWSGEVTPEFLARMTNDCLRFKPTIATTCYGMNDHCYRPYEPSIGDRYRKYTTAIVESFKAHEVRVILGSSGCIGKVPFWAKDTNDTPQVLNLNLCELRNIDVGIARAEKIGFADVFWPMLTAGVTARREYGANYGIAGRDGVHPFWAGHVVMAYAFLKALGLDGEIGTLTLDLATGKMEATAGHEVLSAHDGVCEIRSSRYPFCACVPAASSVESYPTYGGDDLASDDSIRSGETLVPFNEDLNQFKLVAKHGKASNYKVSWGTESKTFTSDQLAQGINLAAEYPENPFSAAFAKVDAAVIAKQVYETKQIKELFRSPEAKTNLEAVVKRTERDRAALVALVKSSFVPVTHILAVSPE
jgi:lysophospholipase L1-like esterase